METTNKYFGGTGITLEKLKQVYPKINVDGTTYHIEEWIKECSVFDALVPLKSKVWIPYRVWEYRPVTKVVWKKKWFKDYSFCTEETQDWWVAVPYCLALHDDVEYYVYEITFYKKWKRKTQMKHLIEKTGLKRKYLTKKEIGELKKAEAIENSKKKRILK